MVSTRYRCGLWVDPPLSLIQIASFSMPDPPDAFPRPPSFEANLSIRLIRFRSPRLELLCASISTPIIATGMSHYLHPLSIPSRNNSLDESPYSQSSTSGSRSTTPSRSASGDQHFLNIPGLSSQHIKDADSVDKLATAAAATTSATTASSSSSSASSSS